MVIRTEPPGRCSWYRPRRPGGGAARHVGEAVSAVEPGQRPAADAGAVAGRPVGVPVVGHGLARDRAAVGDRLVDGQLRGVARGSVCAVAQEARGDTSRVRPGMDASQTRVAKRREPCQTRDR